VLIKKYEEVMKVTPQERMLEAQRAANVVKDKALEGEKCQKKTTKTKKLKKK